MFNPSAGDRSDVANIAVLITDGVATREETRTILDANALKDTGVTLLTLGITEAVDKDMLAKMSSTGDVFFAESFSDLEHVLEGVTQQLCITPAPPRMNEVLSLQLTYGVPERTCQILHVTSE